MFFTFKPQADVANQVFPPISDPWTLPLDSPSWLPTLPRRVPLDPSHELVGVPIPEALMPEGVPAALRLSVPFSVRSAIAILLRDEIKLAEQVDEDLRHDIEDAIALLALADA